MKQMPIMILMLIFLFLMSCDVQSIENDKSLPDTMLTLDLNQNQLIKKLGNKYTLETVAEGGYFSYTTYLKYEGITFHFYHNEPKCNPNALPHSIILTSNRYRYDVNKYIGMKWLEARHLLTKLYTPSKDFHSQNSDLYSLFEIGHGTVDGHDQIYNIILYDSLGQKYPSEEVVPKGSTVERIQIYIALD